MPKLSVAGGQIFVEARMAADEAPWLVLSNPIGTDRSIWDGQMQALGAEYNIIRYDTRGHGDSDPIPGRYDFDMLVDDIEAILDTHRIGRVSFMGMSLGGMTGLGFALRRPDRIERLVCCNARADAPPGFVTSWDDRIGAIEQGGMEAIVSASMDRWLMPETRASQPTLVDSLSASLRKTSTAGYIGCAEALKTLNYLGKLETLKCPVLYVAGADDTAAPAPVMQEMAAATPDARIAILPDCAHLSNLDRPDKFLGAVQEFLTR